MLMPRQSLTIKSLIYFCQYFWLANVVITTACGHPVGFTYWTPKAHFLQGHSTEQPFQHPLALNSPNPSHGHIRHSDFQSNALL